MDFSYFLSVLCPYLLIKAWQNWPALFVQHQYLEVGLFCLPVLPIANVTWPNWHASKEQTTFCLSTSKNVFDSVLADIQNAEQEMFEKFGGGETSASKDRLFKLCHVRQTMLVNIARP